MNQNPRFFWRALALTAVAFGVAGCPDDPEPVPACIPSGAEQCGGGDENCDGFTDEPGAVGCADYRADADGDGRPDGDESRCLCAPEPPFTLPVGVSACAAPCDDGNPCTTDSCDEGSGTCVFDVLPDGSACEDLDPCTIATTCTASVCGGGTERSCDDAGPCEIGRCLPGYGCSYIDILDVACDDGDTCTTNDRCTETGCVGTLAPACAPVWCGDGICGFEEDCANCPKDCSPVGFGGCGAPCNPLDATSCGADAACVPSDNGGFSAEVMNWGNGLCGGGCRADADCGANGACLRVFGVEAAGVCRPRCAPRAGGVCAVGSCIPSPEDATIGACREGVACDPENPDACGEMARCTVVGNESFCLGACAVNDPVACGGSGCTALSGARYREGICLEAPETCDPWSGWGCAAGEVCAFAYTPFVRGRGAFCFPVATETPVGAACDGVLLPCGPGRICTGGVCAALCDPSGASGQTCAGGAACLEVSERLGLADGSVGFCDVAVCGDGRCEPGENCRSCAADCGACALSCGDGVCTGGTEDCRNCPDDCGGCAGCGDGICGAGEDCEACPDDCGVCRCGDGVCQGFEDCNDCAGDCGPCEAVCGDGICGRTERCDRCPADCGACAVRCGDGVCAVPGETHANCPGDCPVGQGLCGDGLCDGGEDCARCPGDCATAFDGALRCAGACVFGGAACGAGAACFPLGADGGFDVAALVGSDNAGRAGRCVGASRPCEPAGGSGCGATETCTVVGFAVGQAVVFGCNDVVGTAPVGSTCNENDLCDAGLWCVGGRCVVPCRSGTCASGTCTDVGAELPWFTLAATGVGVCR